VAIVVSMGAAAIRQMKPPPTDINPPAHRWRNLVPLRANWSVMTRHQLQLDF
jgi:hypothetical protein